MKIINEKGLALYAGSGAPADKEGYLLKKGEVNKGFQKRWFVLKGNFLFYYEKKGDREPIGMIVLEGCTIELAENTDNFTFQIVFPHSGCRTYVISAESQEIMESWMKALSCAGYDYVKLMVSELQFKLSELSSDTAKSVIQEADRNSIMLSNVYENSPGAVGGSFKTPKSHAVVKRKNPFNSMKNMTLDWDSVNYFNAATGQEAAFTSSKTLARNPRTFQQMHEEISKQFKMFSEDWRNKTDVNSNLNAITKT
ncbi:hypothetical protein SNE40_002556 [Patella caerulea]|uniref:PH domain-containing protein n=1 Tax=Patella caerulea TaxID=87958 RepID=A0AAN8K6B2_PATCE